MRFTIFSSQKPQTKYIISQYNITHFPVYVTVNRSSKWTLPHLMQSYDLSFSTEIIREQNQLIQ